MTYLSIVEGLANDVASGAYRPAPVDSCESSFTLDRNPQVVRFVEFTLFTEPKPSHPRRPRYLVLQPQLVLESAVANRLEGAFRQHVVQLVSEWDRGSVRRVLPSPGSTANEIREAVQGIAGGSLRPSSELGSESVVKALPPIDLKDTELKARYSEWLGAVSDRSVRERLERVSGLMGGVVEPPELGRPLRVPDLTDPLVEIMFPGPYQVWESLHSPVALCATFEQVWRPAGYTRGELVGSLSLAPGERLTMEMHSWDKSTRKSEDELSTELEMRTAEKLTQRDSLTVAQEYSKQRNSNVSASGTVPIPKMPVSVSGQVSTQTSESLRRTREAVREQTAEASNTLKINRKTRVEVSRETGREEKQTRVLENTNRCHSLNCHYFEVVSNYIVTTRLVSVRPCVLLQNPRPSFTRDWVLCHEGTLIEALLDRTFLPGFDGARALKVFEVMEQLEAKARLADLERLGEQLTPHASAILDSYDALKGAHEEAVAAMEGCGGVFRLLCIIDNLTPITMERVVSWFALTGAVRAALDRLAADMAAGRNAAEALRSFLLLVGPSTLTQTVGETAVEQALEEFYNVDKVRLRKDLLSHDDAGLRAAVEAASQLVTSLPRPAGAEPVVPSDALANAQVEFERLQCHLEENWLHYSQAIWLREDHGQRLMRLQAYGAIASMIENELLGFYGDRAAYPLRDVSPIKEVKLTDVIAEAEKEIEGAKDEPVLISMPTPGLLLEAMVGDCNACEGFIEQSRLLDLRQQEAKARQEEAEADRRAQRLAATPPDFSDPNPRMAPEIRVLLESGDSNGGGSD